MKKHISMRFASMLLILALFVGLIAPANAINPADNGAKLSVTQVDNSEVSATPLSRQLEEPTDRAMQTQTSSVSLLSENRLPPLQPASPAMALPRTSKQWPIAQI